MLETIREYGLESLTLHGELPALQRLHAEYFLALAEEAEIGLRGPEQPRWFERLETEHDNLRAALAWGLSPDGDPELALRLAGAVSSLWQAGGHFEEGRRWLSEAMRRSSSPSPARVKALVGLAWLAHI
jgi:non-specific serine/threonine protein kinase